MNKTSKHQPYQFNSILNAKRLFAAIVTQWWVKKIVVLIVWNSRNGQERWEEWLIVGLYHCLILYRMMLQRNSFVSKCELNPRTRKWMEWNGIEWKETEIKWMEKKCHEEDKQRTNSNNNTIIKQSTHLCWSWKYF